MSWISEAAARTSNRFWGWMANNIMERMPTAVAGQHQPFTANRDYGLRWQYYINNDPYGYIREVVGRSVPAARGLYNPVYLVAEFYAARLWPGTLPDALPIVAEREGLETAVRQIWSWSNFGQRKQGLARRLPIFGDSFIKVAGRRDGAGRVTAVYQQQIDPRHVWDFETDERGYVTWIRIDSPFTDWEADPLPRQMVQTEVISKARGDMRIWRTPQADYTADRREPAADPDEILLLSSFGIDFVPVVHTPCVDIGTKRGWTPFDAQLDKIDELNRMATRLHEIIFAYDKPILGIKANQVDSAGRPMPAPKINATADGSEDETIGGVRVMRFPGNSEAEWLVPGIDFEPHIRSMVQLMEEIEANLPEFRLQRLAKMNQVAADTVDMLLGDAEARLLEVRGNAETGLAQANAMALTIAQNAKVEGFGVKEIGTYAAGDFSHTFAERPVFLPASSVRATTAKTLHDAGTPTKQALKMSGWSETEMDGFDDEAAAEALRQRTTFAATMVEARRRLDSGEASNGAERP